MTEPLRNPAAAFSPEAEQELARALTDYLSSWSDDRHDRLTFALSRLCTEAHEQSLGPERMLVAVKEAWARVPVDRSRDPDRKAVAFERVLSACLDSCYGGR